MYNMDNFRAVYKILMQLEENSIMKKLFYETRNIKEITPGI